MADLEVIFDPDKEMACIVNTESHMGFGPAMIGPFAGQVLQAFIDATPFDVSLLTEHGAAAAFASFLETQAAPAAATPANPDLSPLGPIGGPRVDDGRLEDRTAAESGAEPPAVQPADTDEPAPDTAASSVVTCFNCNGAGVIEFGGDEPSQRCNMCQGTGKILQAQPA